jgi:hypothetical protein
MVLKSLMALLIKAGASSKVLAFLFLFWNHLPISCSELGKIKKDISEIERMFKALIKSLDNKPLNPGTLFSN